MSRISLKSLMRALYAGGTIILLAGILLSTFSKPAMASSVPVAAGLDRASDSPLSNLVGANPAGNNNGNPTGASLVFDGGCTGSCGQISARVCNHGAGDMVETVSVSLYYSSSGNPKNGSLIATGSLGPLKSGECSVLSYEPTATGNYMWKVNQESTHPGQGVLWSDTCSVNSLCTPEVTETTPVVTETTPVVTETTPAPTETTPAPTETTPVPTETTPVVTETTPAPTETTPAPTETTPVVTETTPAPTETTPVPTETTPAATETTPAPTETTPVPTETTPAATETTPVPTETTPVPTETTPAPTETTPAPTETTPAPTETTPVPTETTPAATETTPVVTETTPVPTETTPVPTETTPVVTEIASETPTESVTQDPNAETPTSQPPDSNTEETAVPTLAPPPDNSSSSVLIPVTGVDLSNPTGREVGRLLTNLGLVILGLAMVLTGILRRSH